MAGVEINNENSPKGGRHPLNDFGIYVKDRCLRMGMSQAELARGLNINPSSLSRILRGHRQPSRRLELAARHLLEGPTSIEIDHSPADPLLPTSNNQLREEFLKLEERMAGLEETVNRIVSILERHFT